jgi:hypothetical protein
MIDEAGGSKVLREELGRDMGDLFEWFDPTPVGSASLAQVSVSCSVTSHRLGCDIGPEELSKALRPAHSARAHFPLGRHQGLLQAVFARPRSSLLESS